MTSSHEYLTCYYRCTAAISSFRLCLEISNDGYCCFAWIVRFRCPDQHICSGSMLHCLNHMPWLRACQDEDVHAHRLLGQRELSVIYHYRRPTSLIIRLHCETTTSNLVAMELQGRWPCTFIHCTAGIYRLVSRCVVVLSQWSLWHVTVHKKVEDESAEMRHSCSNLMILLEPLLWDKYAAPWALVQMSCSESTYQVCNLAKSMAGRGWLSIAVKHLNIDVYRVEIYHRHIHRIVIASAIN